MKNKGISDKDVAIGFIMFAFVKAYKDTFLPSISRIIKIAYENGLLLRYGFLIILLLIYSLLPYIILIYFSIIWGDPEKFYLLHFSSCILLFIFIKNFFQNFLSLLTSALLSILTVYLVSEALQVSIGDLKIFFSNGSFKYLLLSLFINFYIYFGMLLILFIFLDYVIKPCQFFILSHFVIFNSPKNSLILLNKILNFIKFNVGTIIIVLLSYWILISGLLRLYLNNEQVFTIYHFLWFYMIFFLSITIFLNSNEIRKEIEKGLIVFLLLIILFIFIYLYEQFKVDFITMEQSSREESVFILELFVVLKYSLIIGVILFYLFKDFFKTIFINLIPEKWLIKKYNHLYQENTDIIFQYFTAESLPKARIFILQFVLTSPSPLTKKIEILREMTNDERRIAKVFGTSQEVLDEIAILRQTLRQEQRQTESIGNVPIAQNSLQNVTGFDFTDPILENHHHTAISPIDFARQQLLDWLKGETPANPSIDKLLIYQWQDYEIGIGLKYSGQMGGDFYDLFQLPTANADNQVGVVISDFGLLVGDLTGHGVETALNLSKTHNFWTETDLSQDVLTTMRAFEQNFKKTFHPFPKYEGCELCYLQLKDNEITLSRAGLHLGLIQNNQWHNIAPLPDENFGSLGNWRSLPVKRYTRVKLKAGETLIVYTDGLFENANQNGDQFGQDKFQQLLLQHHHEDMNTLINTLFEAVYEFCQPEPLEDDETLLIIRRKNL